MHTSYFSIFQEGKEETKKSDEHDSKKIMDYELRPRLNRADENTTEEATTLITTTTEQSSTSEPSNGRNDNVIHQIQNVQYYQ